MDKDREHSKARRKSGGDEAPSLLSPATSSAVTPTTTASSPRSGRSSSVSLFTFEAFRRRSKSDSKPNHHTGATSGTSTPSGIHRKSKLFHSFKNHIPWGRSSSIDPASTSGSSQGSGSSHSGATGTSGHRYHHHGNIPHLPNHHHLDPYYTFTYGDTRQHNRPRSRSSSGGGSSVARVMDIFTRNKSGDALKDADKYQTGPHRKSIDFGDLGALMIY